MVGRAGPAWLDDTSSAQPTALPTIAPSCSTTTFQNFGLSKSSSQSATRSS